MNYFISQKLLKFVVTGSALLFSSAYSQTIELKPPVAAKRVKIDVRHGDRRVDNYFWMREKSNPEVIDYLQAENDYAEAVLKTSKPLQEKLFDEMKGRIPATETTVPYRQGNYYYYSRTETGKQYRILCRKIRQEDGSFEASSEEILLDENQLASGNKFFELGVYSVSPDGSLLAYSTDTTGYRQYGLHMKNLRTGELLEFHRPRVTSVAWANDNQTLFYVNEDAITKRADSLYRHAFSQAADRLIFREKDAQFRLELQTAIKGDYLFLRSSSSTSSEVSYLSTNQAEGNWRNVLSRKPNIDYDAHIQDGYFYLRINDKGKNFRLVKIPIDQINTARWQEVTPHRADVKLEGIQLFRDFMVIHERENGVQQIAIQNLTDGKQHRIEFPEAIYAVSASDNMEWDTSLFRYSYQSLTKPISVFEYEMAAKHSKLIQQQAFLGGFDAKDYISERRFAKANDGAMIPISLVYKKGIPLDGTAPLYLMAYGAYGSTVKTRFSIERQSLLDRGVIVAMAHVRGGGDLGSKWYDQGKMLKKKNTFTDFISCAESLIEDKYTQKNRLVIGGRSAGGLLMGAVTNMRPDLFKAVLTQVPFVDTLNTMLDPTLPLVVGEYQEWGNPTVKKYYQYIKSYSPYDNLKAGKYPTILVKTSLNDSQVMYWEPAKYVAKLRTLKRDNTPLLFVTNMNAGHGGASGRFDGLHDVAFDYAFILNQMGIEVQPY